MREERASSVDEARPGAGEGEDPQDVPGPKDGESEFVIRLTTEQLRKLIVRLGGSPGEDGSLVADLVAALDGSC